MTRLDWEAWRSQFFGWCSVFRREGCTGVLMFAKNLGWTMLGHYDNDPMRMKVDNDNAPTQT